MHLVIFRCIIHPFVSPSPEQILQLQICASQHVNDVGCCPWVNVTLLIDSWEHHATYVIFSNPRPYTHTHTHTHTNTHTHTHTHIIKWWNAAFVWILILFMVGFNTKTSECLRNFFYLFFFIIFIIIIIIIIKPPSKKGWRLTLDRHQS